MSRDAFFFKHDYNARNDPKMVRLRRELGSSGYGIAWMLVEMLHENGGRISWDPDFLAFELREPRETIEKVVATPVFFVQDGMLGSPRVDRERDERRAASMAGAAFGARRKRPDGSPWVKHGPPMGTHRGPITHPMPGEERREDNDRAFGGRDKGQDGENGSVKGLKELTEDLAASKFFDTNTDPLYRRCAVRGAHHGRKFVDIPADEAEFMLANTPRLSQGQREGLQARVNLKKSESKTRREQ